MHNGYGLKVYSAAGAYLFGAVPDNEPGVRYCVEGWDPGGGMAGLDDSFVYATRFAHDASLTALRVGTQGVTECFDSTTTPFGDGRLLEIVAAGDGDAAWMAVRSPGDPALWIVRAAD